jgi:hypothetical protein
MVPTPRANGFRFQIGERHRLQERPDALNQDLLPTPRRFVENNCPRQRIHGAIAYLVDVSLIQNILGANPWRQRTAQFYVFHSHAVNLVGDEQRVCHLRIFLAQGQNAVGRHPGNYVADDETPQPTFSTEKKSPEESAWMISFHATWE